MKRTNNTLRWIGVLPCALLASYIVQWLVGWLFTFAYRFGYNEDIDSSLVLSYSLPFIVQLLTGYSFVMAGVWCAPARHKEVAIGLAILTSVASIMNFIASGYLNNPVNYAIVGGRIAGVIWAIYRTKTIEKAEII